MPKGRKDEVNFLVTTHSVEFIASAIVDDMAYFNKLPCVDIAEVDSLDTVIDLLNKQDDSKAISIRFQVVTSVYIVVHHFTESFNRLGKSPLKPFCKERTMTYVV